MCQDTYSRMKRALRKGSKQLGGGITCYRGKLEGSTKCLNSISNIKPLWDQVKNCIHLPAPVSCTYAFKKAQVLGLDLKTSGYCLHVAQMVGICFPIWVWLKIQELGSHKFLSLVHLGSILPMAQHARLLPRSHGSHMSHGHFTQPSPQLLDIWPNIFRPVLARTNIGFASTSWTCSQES